MDDFKTLARTELEGRLAEHRRCGVGPWRFKRTTSKFAERMNLEGYWVRTVDGFEVLGPLVVSPPPFMRSIEAFMERSGRAAKEAANRARLIAGLAA